jgi:SAM-dependent methyltransferase
MTFEPSSRRAMNQLEPPPDEIARLRRFRSRGTANLEVAVGGVVDAIEARLTESRPPRVLEIGCGYGMALVELRARFGDRIDLHAINRYPRHGTWNTARQVAVQCGSMSDAEFLRLAPPTISIHDVDASLPFPDDHFDLIYSQMSFPYYKRKAEVLEEIDRVLAPGGEAKIDVHVELRGMPVEYTQSFEIWKGGVRVPFWSFIRGFESLSEGAGRKRPFLAMRKAPNLRLGLTFAGALDLEKVHDEWWGTKSIYRVTSGT